MEKHNDVLHDIVETILFSMAQYDDDIYKIHCYHILGVLVAHHASSLSDSTLWDVINQLFKSLIKYKLSIHLNNSNSNGYSTASSSNNMDSNHIMYNAAENLLQQVPHHSLTHSFILSTYFLLQIIKSVFCAADHVPCVMKLLSFLIQILKKFIDGAQVRIVNKKMNPLSRSNSVSNGAFGGGIEAEIMELFMALKVLKFCLLSTDNRYYSLTHSLNSLTHSLTHSFTYLLIQSFASIIYSYKPILSMIRDDLCNTMILLITIHNEYTSFVFQGLVELFCVIVCKLGNAYASHSLTHSLTHSHLMQVLSCESS